MKKRLAFIIPTHRRPALLEAVVETVRAQIVPDDWEMDIFVAPTPRDTVPDGVTRVEVGSIHVGAKLDALWRAAEGYELICVGGDDDLQSELRVQASVEAYEGGAAWTGSSMMRSVRLPEMTCCKWVGRSELTAALTGTTHSLSREALEMVDGWPHLERGVDGALRERLARVGITCTDVAPGGGMVTTLEHGRNIWARAHPDNGEIKYHGTSILVGEGAAETVKDMEPLHKRLIHELGRRPRKGLVIGCRR